jgi:tetratricopeptide (TPR) repeat protein
MAEPSLAKAWGLLGIALGQQGILEESAACLRRAVELQPDSVENHLNLGINSMKQKRLDEALASFRSALALKPESVTALNCLGNVLTAKGQIDAAIASYRQALCLQPDLAAYNNLGLRLKEQLRLDEAASCFRQALALVPNSVEVLVNLGSCLKEQAQLEQALACFQEAVRLRPQCAEAHSNWASALMDLGRLPEALHHYREALRAKPHYPHAFLGLGELVLQGMYQFTEEEESQLRWLAAWDDLTFRDRISLQFLRASLLDRQQCYDEAFAVFHQANALRRQFLQERGDAFQAEQHRIRIDGLIAFFDRSYFQQVETVGLETDLPVFIVGMPRSGTSLVEQILASHPQVFGAGERKDIRQIVATLARTHEDSTGCTPRIDPDTARSLAEQYLNRLAALGGTSLRVTDKMPENYLHLGTIFTLFRRARVIHCRRHPLDVCWSCYTQNFQGLGFASSLDDLGMCYRAYLKLMAHWRTVLPRPMLEVDYEELVANPENVSRRLIAFCGLDWDERCLAFHANLRVVQTASRVQVRRPMYKESVGRWKRYEKYLKSLADQLLVRDGSPW